MTEFARNLDSTSPLDNPTPEASPPPPEPQRCSLCSAPLTPQAERCASCGLWMGGRGQAISRSTLWWVTGVFVSVYATALLFVALAR